MEAYEVCHPCIVAVRDFGIFEWFVAFLFALFTLISLLTRINIFSLLKTVGETMDKALNASKREKQTTVKVEGEINAVTTTEQTQTSVDPSSTPGSPS